MGEQETISVVPVKRNFAPALVLNADYRPLSYLPLSLWHWEDAVKAVFQEKATVVATYNRTIRSPSFEMKQPSVIALNEFASKKPAPAFTRFNVFLRDSFCCQYCGNDPKDLTFDHVIPRCRGGQTTWENITSACIECNLKKGSKSLAASGLKLHSQPYRPTAYSLESSARKFPPNFLHSTWVDYLYWDIQLDPTSTDNMFMPYASHEDVPTDVVDTWLQMSTPARSSKSRFLKQAGLHAA